MKFIRVLKASDLHSVVEELKNQLNYLTPYLEDKVRLKNLSKDQVQEIEQLVSKFNNALKTKLTNNLYGYIVSDEDINKIKQMLTKNFIQANISVKPSRIMIEFKDIPGKVSLSFRGGSNDVTVRATGAITNTLVAHTSFDQALTRLEQYLQRKSKRQENFTSVLNSFKKQLMEKLKEGEKKGIVDWLDGVYLRDGKVEIIYSTHRKFRHPDEYFDMRYDTPEELQEYNQWEYEFDNIISDFQKKHNIEIDMHA